MDHRELPLSFYSADAPDIAPALIGKILARRFIDGRIMRLLIVETEAYMPTDPASHAFRGPTARNAAMFDAGGHVYVYFIYGVHYCLNIVTGKENDGQAVLIRALSPLDWNEKKMRRSELRAFSGPGKLCKSLEIDRSNDRQPLTSKAGSIWIENSPSKIQFECVNTTRIGISKAQKTPWRWYWRDHPAVSRY